ncbi:SRPBCC family protein [Nocardia sp. XZ_19_369]|uniref:SRPBCC family protein n=1 Tax=Nocardia sp. XZ_19_369 TaxID=2769487 RepID=UPI00188DF2BC|nr:SRPBCC family protein [Nocardia sp. XZ_19_369]
METIVVERTIAAPLEKVFEWCATTTNYERTAWVLRDKLTRPSEGAAYGVGAIRRHTWLIGHFYERITSYEPPHSFGYAVDRSFPPIPHKGASMTFTTVPGGTRVVWTTAIDAGSFVGSIARTVVGHVFGRILNACAKELASK